MNRIKNIIFSLIRELLNTLSVITTKVVVSEKRLNLNPLNKLYTKTYDGKNEAVHNKVIYFKDKFNGWHYWRCYTPFTKTDCKVENPSIAVSNDGFIWTIPNGLKNPIEDLENEKLGFNSDPHLVYNNGTKQMECWFRYCNFKGGEYIYRKFSSNGIDWSDKELIRFSEGTFQSLVCPVVLYNKGKYQIWILVNDNDSFEKGSYIKYYESRDGKEWEFIRDILVKIEPDHMPWHFDVEIYNNIYYLVYSTRAISDYNKLDYISIAISNDNISYKSNVLVTKSSQWYRWDNYKMHRPCILFTGRHCFLYYSAQNRFLHWGSGVINLKNKISL